ncbi:MAG TPA: hypothetical protein VMD03_02795 [Steroidobacteraceae bacterium]|nr:hypothetical protein [Steroidobacteraceae bacterium]
MTALPRHRSIVRDQPAEEELLELVVLLFLWWWCFLVALVEELEDSELP